MGLSLRALARGRRAEHLFGQAEVGHLRHECFQRLGQIGAAAVGAVAFREEPAELVGLKKNIGGFEVAVNDAAFVGVLDADGHGGYHVCRGGQPYRRGLHLEPLASVGPGQ